MTKNADAMYKALLRAQRALPGALSDALDSVADDVRQSISIMVAGFPLHPVKLPIFKRASWPSRSVVGRRVPREASKPVPSMRPTSSTALPTPSRARTSLAGFTSPQASTYPTR